MFDGMQRRVVSMWFPRLASDRVLRVRPVEAPFVLTIRQNNTERVHCLNARAERAGLSQGMNFADARAFCPDMVSRPARPDLDARFLATLRRWAVRYCPWVGREGEDGLVLDVTGSTHIWGGEDAMLDDMRARATRSGLSLQLGVAGTRGAAWARAHYGNTPRDALSGLPVAALHLDKRTVTSLQRLGLRTIGALSQTPRAPLARRFGPLVLVRLDQALGDVREPVTPEAEQPHYAIRLSCPDPIGLVEGVMGGIARLLAPLCDKLKRHEAGARAITLTLRRVDQGSQKIELRLASAMRDPARILPLFERGVNEVDAGFGIDQIRLEATVVEPLPAQQIATVTQVRPDQLNDLITRIGTRIGLENIQRFLPADSHIPERSFLIAPAAFSQPSGAWGSPRPRPLRLFPPEPIRGTGAWPPKQFRWRRMSCSTARATGPERIAPEWWLADENWRTGLRDYWKIDTREGQRLWLFHTPQNPSWFVHGEFA